MRTWLVASLTMNCGYAIGCTIAPGESYCLIEGKNWKKVRCAKHTSQQEDIQPTTRTEASGPSSFIAAKELARALPKSVLRFDARQAAAGRDDE